LNVLVVWFLVKTIVFFLFRVFFSIMRSVLLNLLLMRGRFGVNFC